MKKYFNQLGNREQRVLPVATPVIALLIIYLVVIQPVTKQNHDAQIRLKRVVDDIGWLQVQAEKGRFTDNRCSGIEDAVNLTDIAQRYNLVIEEKANSGTVERHLLIRHGQGNKVLDYFRGAACQGYYLKTFNLTTVDSEGQVTGDAVFIGQSPDSLAIET